MTSLYQVPDAETRQLMEEFYAGLKANQGKLKSLRDAQLKLLYARHETWRSTSVFLGQFCPGWQPALMPRNGTMATDPLRGFC